jgi:ribosomal-protein-alanine N-acetyltransferase
MEELRFRFMQLADVDQVHELEKLCFTLPWSKQAFINELTQNHFARYIVLEGSAGIIAYGGMWLVLDEAHITNVAVHPEYRGMKLGEQMMRQLMELAREWKAARMTLEVRASNIVAQNLYRKLGFVATGIRPGYYTDNNEDAVIMWVEL